MTLAFKLTLPVLIGGAVALIASGVFTPYVHAASFSRDTIARVSTFGSGESIHLRTGPSAQSDKSASLPIRSWVWIERCVDAGDATDWCLVAQSGVTGWVEASHLTPHWD